jgi:hypothetical protein
MSNVISSTFNPLEYSISQITKLQRTTLIGSRYYGNYRNSSDYDFMTIYHNIPMLLEQGFCPLESPYNDSYELDNLTSEVLRKYIITERGKIDIDVQISNDFSKYFKKFYFQKVIKENFLYQLPTAYFKNFVWEINNLLATIKIDNDNVSLFYLYIDKLIKQWIDDIPTNRFFMLCSKLVHKEVTPLANIRDLQSQPNVECFNFIWNIKLGV